MTLKSIEASLDPILTRSSAVSMSQKRYAAGRQESGAADSATEAISV